MKEESKSIFQKVMIVDDNNIDVFISSRMIIKNYFSKEVLQYTNAPEALQYLKDNQENITELPQIIFIDIYMPMMSGFEFFEEYERLSDTLKNHCKAYMLSSTIDKEDISLAEKNKNIVGFLAKPITKEFFEEFNSEASNNFYPYKKPCNMIYKAFFQVYLQLSPSLKFLVRIQSPPLSSI
ncbi:response regulator [Flavobacterium sp. GT3R68]|uniref:response regulator n=1 Tax=Flavobacterium sp. GT3R68 TaxID=2594437 RepID=UPI000F88931E|nr:response regulator [Flavobacterium sp. GT3R68]RTY89834.1 response regulator [Flavobacterium sp. GSN2]TRW89813.1 response regulator [Flavobacterium sp. GT3R68]